MVSRPKRPRRSIKQQVWTFMRRNRQFRTGDVMMILGVSKSFLMPIFRALELAGYLELETSSDNFNDRHYKFKKDTGIRSPTVLKKPFDIIKDENTGDEIILDGNHPLQVADKLILLHAMKHKQMFREQIAVVANIHQFSAKMIRYMSEFTEDGIMERISRPNNQGRRMFLIHHDKREALIRELESRGNA